MMVEFQMPLQELYGIHLNHLKVMVTLIILIMVNVFQFLQLQIFQLTL
jgi:hypothetical protein